MVRRCNEIGHNFWKSPHDVTLTTSKESLHKHINELVASGRCQIKNLKKIFSHAFQEEQKQKIRALDFGEKSNFDSISNCYINAIKSDNCFKYGSDSHYIKDCPLSKDDNGTQPKRQYSYQNKTSNNSSTYNAIEPLTKLFNNLV